MCGIAGEFRFDGAAPDRGVLKRMVDKLARRWDDPAFPAAFPWFNTQHYWQERILELREQIALMQEEPLWPS